MIPKVAPDRWGYIRDIAEAARRLRPAARSAFVERTCGSDPGLRAEVESMIDSLRRSAEERAMPSPAPGADPDDNEPDNNIGHRIGAYEIVAEVARGGMGTVYRAVRADGQSASQVAIKLIKRGMDDAHFIARFRREQQIMADLDHPNIGRLLDGASTESGLPYLVMEYIEGRRIDRYCDERRMTVRDRLELFRVVCSAVQYAHGHFVVHRDIKPGNILITSEGVPKLLDFGIAKILNPQFASASDSTVTAVRIMTPDYASPEQVRGERVGPASDIYSLGVLLYELLSGTRPYSPRNPNPHGVARAICEVDPEPPSFVVQKQSRGTAQKVSVDRSTRPDELRKMLAGDLDNIVMTAMRKVPQRRYASVEQLAEDVRRYLEGFPVSARKDGVSYRTWKFLKRNKEAVAVGGAALAIAVGLLASRPDRGIAFSQPPVVAPFTTLSGDESQPVFSPDGRRIAFVWNGSGRSSSIYVRPLDAGSMSRITGDAGEDDSPVWSPDGRSIAFLRRSADRAAIFVVPSTAQGVPLKVVDLLPNRSEVPSLPGGKSIDWSPDGTYLAVRDRGSADDPFSLFLVDVRSRERSRLTTPDPKTVGDRNPAFSPDGKYVSFIRATGGAVNDLYIVAVNGHGARRLTSDNRDILAQTWTPDSKHIVFSSNRLGSFSLWSISREGGDPDRLAGIGMYATDPTFSRDGKRLAYTSFAMDTNIWRRDLAGRLPPVCAIASTQYDSSPTLSPDGKWVALRSSRSGTHEIWVTSIDGAETRQMTAFNGPLTGTPRWSPDGEWIAFDSRPEGPADIFVISAAGGKPRQLTNEPTEEVVPSWSHDSRWVYFASNRSGTWQVWKADVDSGQAEQVTRLGGFAAAESPDGKYLYYAKGRDIGGLWRLRLGAPGEEPVLDQLKPGFWGYWAVTRKGLLFVDQRPETGFGFYFYDLALGQVRRVGVLDGRPMVADSGLAVSADGRIVLYTQIDRGGSDIMIARYERERGSVAGR